MTDNKIILLSSNPQGFRANEDELEQAMFESELPVQHTFSYYDNDDLGLYVGLWDTTAMIEAAGPYACDEFMVILEGKVDIKNCKTGAVETVTAGESFVIPKGYDCQWHQQDYLRKFYVISEHPSEVIPEQAVVDSIVKFEPSTDAENVIHYQDSKNRFIAGTKHYKSIEQDFAAVPNHSFIYLQCGELKLEDQEGACYHFKAGDAFFIPKGVVCKWLATETTVQQYVEVKS
ncbi:cupin domain-containing protein [Thalassotalea psychrophila]|uniref:Cupin domain-containing protein n=1 Tax=Thalassotalea psychrophila TaxID=3065647 RepID=A0ABY9TT78_9GAMM|nr:cupin domain-containing protein [Colwelliaceae bacterium SQ149]